MMREAMSRVLRVAYVIVPVCALAWVGLAVSRREARAGKPEVEIAIFQGGYQLDWFFDACDRYQALHPELHIDRWGDPRVSEKLRPRFIAGDMPDVCWPGWGVPLWKMIGGGKLYAFDAALDRPAVGWEEPTPTGEPPSWRETFLPGMLDQYESSGHVYAVPFDMSVQLFWYNVALFEEHGWAPPETWPEFLGLCQRIKDSGIAPIAFQGRYPTYASFIFLDLLTNLGGTQTVLDCDNLEPGAWEKPEVAQAATLLQELADRYFEQGCMGMSHTEAQMEFVNGRAAIVPCGTWLKSEMKNALPEDFRMSCFKTPRLLQGRGDGRGVQVSAAYWIVPSEAPHPAVGVDFLRYMTSQRNARDFARRKWTIMAVKGCGQNLSPELAQAVAILESATSRHSDRLTAWYPVWNEKFTDAMTALLNGDASPEEFSQRLEAAAAQIRADPWTEKHHTEA